MQPVFVSGRLININFLERYKTEMKQTANLRRLMTSIRECDDRLRNFMLEAYRIGSRNGYGFAIGNENESSFQAIIREGYEPLTVFSGMAIGTNGINSIIAVVDDYGPWAVDITEALLQYNYTSKSVSTFDQPKPRTNNVTNKRQMKSLS